MNQRPERKATVTIVVSDGDMSVLGLPEGVTVEVLDFEWGEDEARRLREVQGATTDIALEEDPQDGTSFVRYTPDTAPDWRAS